MAEQIPYGVVVNVISRLGLLASGEIEKIRGVDHDIQRLKETVETIKAVLVDADQKQQKEQRIQLWIRRLKKVLLEADDLLDELHTQHLLRKRDRKGKGKVRDFFSSSNPILFRGKIARKIKKIRDQFNAVAEDISQFNLEGRAVVMRPGESNPWETSSCVLQEDIIGREESKKEVINFLLNNNNNQNISLIAIVGMGGLGKTALAQLAYNDAEVEKYFNKRMWVCVSEEFNVKVLVKKILGLPIRNDGNDEQLEQLHSKLRENLNGQRYLLVLDDVWNEDPLKWSDLKKYLLHGAKGSTILVTTRSHKVADCMGVETTYDLKGLTNDQSWDLLKRLAFGQDIRLMTKSLESIGRKIAERCVGIPLAVRTIGGMLQSKREESYWEAILEGESWKLSESDNSIMPTLRLSYDHLPMELRQCFAYCSLYPKDWQYDKNDLIELWMAQGYLESQNEGQSEEDVGEHYVHILLTRSFFQDAVIDEVNEIQFFKMHDLMHDLSQSVALSDCSFIEKEIKFDASPLHVNFADDSNCSLDSLDVSRLRSILGIGELLRNETSNLLEFKCLRSLNLSEVEITVLPDSIGKMIHLRYLDLSRCYTLIRLPKSVRNLVNLQTLKLTGCDELDPFSLDVITMMINLRHLYIEYCKAFEDGMPIGLGSLTKLQSLSNFIVANDVHKKRKNAQLNELKELNLRNELTIEVLNLVSDVEEESKDVNLKSKKKLISLTLGWGFETEEKNSDSLQLLENLCPHQNLKQLAVAYYPGVMFSGWLSSLTNLVHLNISNCRNCQFLPTLEGLISLKTLEIVDMDALEYICYEGCSSLMATHTTNWFPSLEELVIYKCGNLKGWIKESDAHNRIDIENHHSLPPFPRLSYLSIEYCPNLSCMPPFPNVMRGLVLHDCCVKPMIDTLLKVSTSGSFATQELDSSLSMLKRLKIDMEIEGLPEEWMKNLTSLKHLDVRSLSSTSVVSLLRHMGHLPAMLEEFSVLFTDNLDPPSGYKDFGIQFAALLCFHSLQNFSLAFCGNLKAVPEWICNLQSLQSLHIGHCSNLESLPEGMHRLTNLQTLSIVHCSKVVTLPEGMHRLTNLQTLTVHGTPLLAGKCKRGTGAEWHKIEHIRNIVVNGFII